MGSAHSSAAAGSPPAKPGGLPAVCEKAAAELLRDKSPPAEPEGFCLLYIINYCAHAGQGE